MSVHVEKNLCPQNHRCPAVAVCRFEALSQDGFDAPRVDEDRCAECGECSLFCPKGALQMEEGGG